jgi:polyhydroxybutyrate depolymerase
VTDNPDGSIMKRLWLLCFLLIALPVFAQETTPDPDTTPEVTPELTMEATPTDEPPQITEAGVYTARDTFNGMVRTYLITVSDAALANAPAPVVFALHGASGSAESFINYSGWQAISEEEGVIIIHPDGFDSQWNDGRPNGVPSDDVGWIAQIVGDLDAMLPIDRSRVYAMGYSMGGMMALRLACTLPDVIAAAASVASTMPAYFLEECVAAPPKPVLFIVGTDDQVVPWIGIRNAYLDALTSLDYWAAHNQCGVVGEQTVLDDIAPDDGTRVIFQEYSECVDDADVQLYGVFGGGHTYPGHELGLNIGLGRTTMDMEAASTIWSFFEEHTNE